VHWTGCRPPGLLPVVTLTDRRLSGNWLILPTIDIDTTPPSGGVVALGTGRPRPEPADHRPLDRCAELLAINLGSLPLQLGLVQRALIGRRYRRAPRSQW